MPRDLRARLDDGIERIVRQLYALEQKASQASRRLADDSGSRETREAVDSMLNDLRDWRESVEGVRESAVELISEVERMQIAHAKLRERLERQPIKPRSEISEEFSVKDLTAAQRIAHGDGGSFESEADSAEYSAIDAELAKLGDLMLEARRGTGDSRDRTG